MKYISVYTNLVLLLFLSSPSVTMGLQTGEADTLQQYADQGRKLFTGQARFANGGAACISCHSVNDPALPVSGGTLAINVTGFSGLPYDALANRILEIPFPRMAEMKAAYAEHPITQQEADKLIGYLKSVAGQQAAGAEAMLSGIAFLWFGLGGCLLFIGLIWVSWYSRKKGSVNRKIYQRQTQSV